MSPRGSRGHGGGGSSGGSGGSNNSSSPFNITKPLKGSHFHDVLPMATFVVSAISLLAFIFIIVWYAWIKGKNARTRNMLHWILFGASTLSMILYVLLPSCACIS